MTMTVLFTRKDYEATPESFPAELHEGAFVKRPSPRWGHQRIQSRILSALSTVLGPDSFTAGPVDVLVDELNVFVPDIVVHDTPPADEAQYVGVPAVVFEVLSPSTEDRDREFKATRYLGLGVKEVWLVDRVRRRIEVATVNGSRVYESTAAAKSDVVVGFELLPEALFSEPA